MTKATLTPVRLDPDSPLIADVLKLIQDSFAFMDGRIDPPSSMHRLSEKSMQKQARDGEIWILGAPPCAVLFLQRKPDCLYLSKLAVDNRRRGEGLARRLVDHAGIRAQEMGVAVLELETRVELVENHTAFGRLGFEKTGETAHPGYDRATSITMQKRLD